MKLTLSGFQDTAAWEKAGIRLPAYDVEAVAKKTRENPVWVHFGAGNIFRIFIGGIADKLLASNEMDRGITCVETFDFDVVDKIYDPYDNLVLAVTLNADATTDKQVIIRNLVFHRLMEICTRFVLRTHRSCLLCQCSVN